MAQNVPGTDRPAEKAAGHWLLAQLGKKVLRPGGRETTEFLLRRVLGGEIDVVEFAPGLGITALEIVKRQPATYTGVDLDPKAAEIVRERIDAANHPNYRVVNASAEETGLPSESFDVVVGEAMLTMQTDHHKLDIMKEAARILRPGGFYAIHELSLTPDYLRPEIQQEIQRDLARSIRVNARPLTVSEWTRLAEEAGFEVVDMYQTDMALLEPKRMIADEGVGMAKILFNLARKPQIRERVLGMRATFRKHADHMGAIGLVLRKKEA
ncbi:MAG: class I SAM-dependent methyltransferase [Rothia sp. (in: high G+C Gram-positive bacteria)]|uniref:class I SAM-dependent methyltransferase n=1 Tax=Rothia sp. (in: high G+C Gram-positive bacteria) TaxID=1885016 RepID=UPI0026DFC367|nr:class I SAM-dependent methyltransferase [Rothia sp. (in: high G+C Gram-positive bacteria)]MDO5749576.1 class I SAM-dependent methyltransferase [Rothia sp. (in: high G+C Gram-positive bacteria)]